MNINGLTKLRGIIIWIILMICLSGCDSFGNLSKSNIFNLSVQAAGNKSTATATLPEYIPPIDSTATATPFQPIPPTEIILPTATETLTPTPFDLPTSTPTLTPLSLPTLTPGPIDIPRSKKDGDLTFQQPPNQMNILLLGSDKRPWGSGFRTDTIILATLNMDLGTVSLTSFPRDLYVNIPGWGTDRINVAWQHGEFKGLANTMEANFGIRPDHYVLINFSSFKRIIDSLGGLEVNVKQPLSDYWNGRWVNVQKGKQYMNADKVLWYVRSRKTTSDFYRGRRQQEVLKAVFEKMLSINGVTRIPEFYQLYKDNVTTDMGWDEIFKWIPLALKMKDGSQLRHYYVSPKEAYDFITYEGAMVLIPRKELIKDILRQALNIP
jgi:LCP family protein required for cell wall assembly